MKPIESVGDLHAQEGLAAEQTVRDPLLALIRSLVDQAVKSFPRSALILPAIP